MWPGFGENSRVLDWIFKRTDVPQGDDSLAVKTPIGYFPSADGINLSCMEEKVDMKSLFHLPKDFWLQEVDEVRKYFHEQVNDDLPPEITIELDNLSRRLKEM